MENNIRLAKRKKVHSVGDRGKLFDADAGGSFEYYCLKSATPTAQLSALIQYIHECWRLCCDSEMDFAKENKEEITRQPFRDTSGSLSSASAYPSFTSADEHPPPACKKLSTKLSIIFVDSCSLSKNAEI